MIKLKRMITKKRGNTPYLWLFLSGAADNQNTLIIGDNSEKYVGELSGFFINLYLADDDFNTVNYFYAEGGKVIKNEIIDKERLPAIDFICINGINPAKYERVLKESKNYLNAAGRICLSVNNRNRGIFKAFIKDGSGKRYLNMMSNAGLYAVKLYGTFPDAYNPAELYDIDKTYIFSFPAGRKVKIKTALKTNKQVLNLFSPAFIVTAANSPNAESIIDKTIAIINERGGRNYRLDAGKLLVNEKGTLVFNLINSSGGKNLIAKTHLNDNAYRSLKRNKEGVDHFRRNSRAGSDVLSVIPVCSDTLKINENIYVFIEELMDGTPAVNFKNDTDKLGQILNNSRKLIEKIGLSTIARDKNTEKIKREIINEKIDNLAVLINKRDENKAFLNKLKSYLSEQLLTDELPLVFKKGDFSANNTFVKSNMRISAVIDWDEYETQFFPMVDLINIMESLKRHHLNVSLGEIVGRFTTGGFTEDERRQLHKYCETMAISEKFITPLTLIYWLEQGFLSPKNRYLIQNNTKWLKNNIYRVINTLGNEVL